MKIIFKVLIGFLNLIYCLFKMMPVKDKVTFISRQADRPTEDIQLLGKALEAADPHLKVIYLCKTIKSGIGHVLAYCFHILRQMYHIATSRVVILDSYCMGVSLLKQRSSLKVIQMWHALGSLKKFGYSILGEAEGRSADTAEAMKMHRNYSYILTSSEECAPHFCQAFGYDISHARIMSLPRVDKITDEKNREKIKEQIYREYPDIKGKKVVVYAPTFRKDKDISQQIDDLAAAFDPDRYAFVLKKHPLMEADCQCMTDDKFSTLEMIFAADYVICDYSAIVFEAALAGKPLFFYAFDYKEYGADRDFYIDYLAEMPGIISPDASEIAKAVSGDDFDLRKVRLFAEKYVSEQRDCTKKLAEFVLKEMQ